MQTSISQILGKTGEILVGRVGPLLGLWASYFVAQIVLFVILVAVMGVSAFGSVSGANVPALGAGMIVAIVVVYIGYLALAFAQAGSLTAMASPLQRLSFSDAVGAGMRSVAPMLGVMVLLLIGYLAAALVIGILAGVLSMLGSVGPIILMLLLVPAGVYLMCRLCLIYAVIAVDRVGNPIKAISRGWGLTRGNVSTIIGVMLIFLVVTIILGGLLFLPFFNAVNASATGAVPAFGGMIFSFIGFFLFSIALSIVSAVLFAVIHSELSDTSNVQTSDVFA